MMTTQSTRPVIPSFSTPGETEEAPGGSVPPGCPQAGVCRQGHSGVKAPKGSPSPKEAEGPVILSSTAHGYFRVEVHMGHL